MARKLDHERHELHERERGVAADEHGWLGFVETAKTRRTRRRSRKSAISDAWCGWAKEEVTRRRGGKGEDKAIARLQCRTVVFGEL